MVEPWRATIQGIMHDEPRQFEYHPKDEELMLVGTMNGGALVWNHQTNARVAEIAPVHVSLPPMDPVLGLCWFKTQDQKFVTGSASGKISVCSMETNQACHNFKEFSELTSVHLNVTDEVQYPIQCG